MPSQSRWLGPADVFAFAGGYGDLIQHTHCRELETVKVDLEKGNAENDDMTQRCAALKKEMDAVVVRREYWKRYLLCNPPGALDRVRCISVLHSMHFSAAFSAQGRNPVAVCLPSVQKV